MPHKNHTGMNHKNHAEWIYKDNFTQRTLLLQKYFVTVVTTETSHKNHSPEEYLTRLTQNGNISTFLHKEHLLLPKHLSHGKDRTT